MASLGSALTSHLRDSIWVPEVHTRWGSVEVPWPVSRGPWMPTRWHIPCGQDRRRRRRFARTPRLRRARLHRWRGRWWKSRRQVNREWRAAHGNTAEPDPDSRDVEAAVADYSVALWNVRGCTTGDTNTNALTEEKVAWLQTQLVTWQADVVFLVEVWGGAKALRRLLGRFQSLGYVGRVAPGPLTGDRSRRTGGLVAMWKPRSFTLRSCSDVGILCEPDLDPPDSQGAAVGRPPESTRGNGLVLALERAGQNTIHHFMPVYGPHGSADGLRFLRACQSMLRGLQDAAWIWLGDFNRLASSSEALPARELDEAGIPSFANLQSEECPRLRAEGTSPLGTCTPA